MRAVVVAFCALAIYGTFKESDASEAFSSLYNPVLLSIPEFKYSDLCAYNGIDYTLDFRRALYEFSAQLFKRIALESKFHCTTSPLSLWMTLAAMAEGTEGPAQEELLRALNLPEDRCQRQEFYKLAAGREVPGSDMSLLRTRVMAYDESLKLNQFWDNFVRSNGLMTTLAVPMKRDPISADSAMRNLIATRQPIDFSGNSAILDSLDMQGLWTSAFSDAIIENSPFYDDSGKQIGTVDMMKMKKRIRMSYIPDLKMKVLELPMGYDGRYRMLLGYSSGSIIEAATNFKNDAIFDVMKNMRTSRIPVDIAIPRFTMTSEINLRPILETMGIRSIWTDSYATRNISEPAVKPSSILQRVTITMDRAGVLPNTDDLPSFLSASSAPLDTETGLDTNVGRDFIANKPFVFVLRDSETSIALMAAIFTRPTSSFQIN